MSDEKVEDFPFDDFPDEEFLTIESQPSEQITDAQRARAERNRQKALALKKARLAVRPYPEVKTSDVHPIDGGPVDQKGMLQIYCLCFNSIQDACCLTTMTTVGIFTFIS